MGDQSPSPLNLVVVGGVAGGMSFAARARRLSESASITVFEKGPFVGYANCGIPYALGGIIQSDEALILQTPDSIKARYNVDIRHSTEVIAIDRENKTVEYKTQGQEAKSMKYDKLILAQGADAFRPPISGSNAPNVFTLQTIPDMTAIKSYVAAHCSKSVAVIGGGFIGLEAAESLHALGMKVSIVEYMPHVFPPVDQDIAEPIHAEIRRNNVDLHLNARVKEIVAPIEAEGTGNGSSHVLLESGEKVPGDIILLVVGVRPRITLAKTAGLEISRFGIVTNAQMQSTTDPDIYAVGDMAETTNSITLLPQNLALAGPANRQGRLAADHIFGRDVSYRGNVGTSVCQIFGINVGLVGPSITSLHSQSPNLDPEYVTVHPPNHAAYYPGATPLTLKLAFSKRNGNILGAQIIGKAGVDKRIDVLATAIQARMTVYDLEHLELAYAPPFGSAKDPVNMAGFVASNVLRGDTEIIHPEDLTPEILDQYQVIDVRSPGEFARGYVRGAKLAPLNELRGRLGDLDREKKVLVYCQVGYRGYLGYRILKQEGFKVVNLDGGFKAVSQGGFGLLVG
ncbi:FAD/NAD(P)-binding domain-containing protein [Lindgomyces ingoldianus]|uniref:FAD/NAD(P)-binding domain-containing protein n=1 Tax=Lindgomyces ingoldianus TaxID=673940 RepID=A0ACB6QHR6_9PLEO|nr:FAD/NAD(P)-binding domain-containing protein [Lindgomyces ingoldianus]KAF2466427.1 FAD/NAD(P)-binding domain-containing protein [Lindgomyces ingoldianus]